MRFLMGRNRLELVNQQFGRLKVLGPAGIAKDGHTLWQCICNCGTPTVAKGRNLKSGITKSCGCYAIESARSCISKLLQQRITPRDRATRKTVNVWRDMIYRCTRPAHPSYHHYGARGITVCQEWMDFNVFLKEMGQTPLGLTLERKDNNKGYSKDNCCWATQKQQARNTRHNHLVTHDGKTMCISAWSELTGISKVVIYGRLKYNWPIEAALFTPPLSRRESGLRAAMSRKQAKL